MDLVGDNLTLKYSIYHQSIRDEIFSEYWVEL